LKVSETKRSEVKGMKGKEKENSDMAERKAQS
jgi:hypothetical protein